MSVLKGVLFENENVLTLWPAVGEESSVKPCIFFLVPLIHLQYPCFNALELLNLKYLSSSR